LEPALPEIWVQLGHAQKEQGFLSEAKVAYERAIELRRYFSDTYLHLGHLSKVTGDSANSWRQYARSLLLDPANRDAAHELRQMGTQSPSSHLDRILDELAKDAAASGAPGFGLGADPPKRGPLARSLEKILKPLRSGGRPVTLSVKLKIRAGDLARDRREWGASAAAYKGALASDRTLGHIWIQLGHALKESGDFVGANAAYLQAGDLRYELGDVALQLGHLCNMMGDTTKARVYYARAVMIDGPNTQAADELHRVVARSGQPNQEALAAFLRGEMSAPSVIEAVASNSYAAQSPKIAMSAQTSTRAALIKLDKNQHSEAFEPLSANAKSVFFQIQSALAGRGIRLAQ
jgi:tetratricopeptide (TPR) repeat protein